MEGRESPEQLPPEERYEQIVADVRAWAEKEGLDLNSPTEKEAGRWDLFGPELSREQSVAELKVGRGILTVTVHDWSPPSSTAPYLTFYPEIATLKFDLDDQRGKLIESVWYGPEGFGSSGGKSRPFVDFSWNSRFGFMWNPDSFINKDLFVVNEQLEDDLFSFAERLVKELKDSKRFPPETS